MIKYPLEIEFTNKCGLKCISCISKDIKNHGELTHDKFDLILDFIKNNHNNIDYITLGGLGDNFLHSDIIKFLDKLKVLKMYDFKILIPTKGVSLNEEIIYKIKELKDEYNMSINLQIGFFSLNEKKQNFLSGLYTKKFGLLFNYSKIFKHRIKQLKSHNLDFSLELLLTKFSETELDLFYKFCKDLKVDGVIHRLHNFGGKLKTYDYLYTNSKLYNAFHCSYDKSFENDKTKYYNDKCGFFPYINYEGNIYPGTFCMHYYIGNIGEFNFNYGFEDLIKKCYNSIDLENQYCSKCIDKIN